MDYYSTFHYQVSDCNEAWICCLTGHEYSTHSSAVY